MNFIECKDGLPRIERNRLKYVFMEFMRMNIKVAKVDFKEREYKNTTIAYHTLHRACKRHAVPITVRMRNGEVYMVRTDM